MSYYLTDGSHVLVSGATGAGDDYGGKSVLANWWYRQAVKKGHHDLGVFFNPKGLTYVSSGDVPQVRTLRTLAKAYKSGSRVIDYYPRDGGSPESHSRLVETLKQLPGDKIVVHDEAQAYGDADSLSWCLAQGGNMAQGSLPTGDIRSLVVTQRPWNLSEELRANMPLKIWVGPFGTEAEHFFSAERMGSAAERVKEETAPYHWSVTDAGDFIETNPPVPEEYANG